MLILSEYTPFAKPPISASLTRTPPLTYSLVYLPMMLKMQGLYPFIALSTGTQAFQATGQQGDGDQGHQKRFQKVVKRPPVPILPKVPGDG